DYYCSSYTDSSTWLF
nr:immunoglobulin light chain junction region [Macaca mulatta]MOV74099.1 immunoglobulin light chain junction region [Macaca mulatta]